MEKDSTILRTYGKVWNHEKKIYSIDRIKLIVPINPNDLLYFAVGLVFVVVITSIIPIFAGVPFVFKYILLPFAIMKFMTKKKLDGKMPHFFLVGCISYLLLPKKISRFQAGERYGKGKFTDVVYRGKEIVDITQEMMSKKGGKKNARFSDKILRRQPNLQ